MPTKAFRDRLRDAREHAGFSSPERGACEATRAHVALSGRELRKWENGEFEPSFEKLRAICYRYGCEARVLLGVPS